MSQNSLGVCYRVGSGCRQDLVEALKWFRLAAAQRVGEGACSVGQAYSLGMGVAQDMALAVSWYRRAVEYDANCSAAMFNLGEWSGVSGEE